mmetsp:Transcript_116694/g.363382  ORF Transcript_116694/g.363382 Transcript_116694/m.363382 type:complete len:426 (+) Transcript_116694:172-1449(+)
MHSLNGFLSEHEGALREHDHLSQEVARLNSLVNSLSRELDMFQNQTQQQEDVHNARQQTLKAKEARTAALRSSVERKRSLSEASESLERSNSILQEQNLKAIFDIETLNKEIDATKVRLSWQQNASGEMEELILQQHRYAEECNHHAGKYESELEVYEKQLEVVRGRSRRVMKVAEMTTKVHDILLQKNTILKARIKKALANTATVQTQTLTTKAQQEQLQKEAQAELARMGRLLGEHMEKEEAAKAELQTLRVGRVAEQRRLEQARADVKKFQKQLLSGDMAKLMANNTHLKAALQEGQNVIQSSQANLMKYQADIEQANQTLASLTNATEESLRQADETAERALQGVIAAKQRDEQAAAEAKEAAMKAESASLMSCNATWDERHTSILEELGKCPAIELELKNLRAENEALTNTITSAHSTGF